MWAVKLCSNKMLKVLNWECQPMKVVLCNGCKMVVVVMLYLARIQSVVDIMSEGE